MLSKYNIYINQDNVIWIYNNFTKKILCLSQEEYYQLDHDELKNYNPNLYKKLIQYGIVYEGEDETRTLLKTHRNNIEHSRLEIMIMSSTTCNFNCTYCYEEFVPKNIDNNFEEAFIKYLCNNIEKYKSLFIEWFGGEPLLAKERVISIAKRAKEICYENHRPFLSSITTNGYYLDYAIFSELLNGNVIYFQVTIDGNREWHNKYRPLKSGEGTYDVVLNNLLSIKRNVSRSKVFRLTIRNNISIENKEACKQFQRIFMEKFGDDERFQLFQFPIKDWGGNKISEIKEQLLDADEVLQINNSANNRNDIFEGIISSCCLAAKKNGFVIDPDYNVYKCNHFIQDKTIKNKHNKVGRLEIDGNMFVDENKNNEWFHPVIAEECYSCSYLPNCLTTCPLHSIQPEDGCKNRIKSEMDNKINNYILKRR